MSNTSRRTPAILPKGPVGPVGPTGAIPNLPKDDARAAPAPAPRKPFKGCCRGKTCRCAGCR
jgi:hypothetical protein